MTLRLIPAAIAVAAVLAASLVACGGGGSTGPSTPPVTTDPQSQGSIPMTFTFRRPPSSSARRPRYLSDATQSLALYDGTTLIYVVNIALDSSDQFQTVYAASGNTSVTPGSCTFTSASATCTATVTTTVGAHKFDVVTYPDLQSTSPAPSAARRGVRATAPSSFSGIILSEGELSVTLVAGANPAKTLSLNGVADQVLHAGLSEAAYNDTVTFGYRILDAGNQQIVQPGGYDNGPVTITAAPAGVVTINPNSITTPPATVGDQNFDVQCVNTAGGTVTISFNAGTHPNTTYAAGLAYTAANYASTPIATIPFTCDAEPATIPITIDAKVSRAHQ